MLTIAVCYWSVLQWSGHQEQRNYQQAFQLLSITMNKSQVGHHIMVHDVAL